MFSRSNLVSKYKACAKSIQGVQVKYILIVANR